MKGAAADNRETAKWDPAFTKQIANTVGPLIKRWYRAEVRNLDNVPSAGGALIVSNHSGGMLTPDVLLFAPAFYDEFGYDRPLYTLAHYGVFIGPLEGWVRRLGAIEASRKNAAAALHSGAVVLVFPGGDYDSYRPTLSANTIDFNGRTGYVRTAVEAGVPIVPTVSIGGQETQLFLTRGNFLARKHVTQVRVLRSENRGFAHANNRGLMAGTGRYVLFLNPDTELLEGSLAGLVAAMDVRPDVGLVGVKQVTADGTLWPTMKYFPGVIGGHCVMPNIQILKQRFKSDILDAVENSNQLKRRDTGATEGGA